jgi:hypothetical protein
VNDLGDWEMLSDVWLFNLHTKVWTQVHHVQTSPIQRFSNEWGGVFIEF